MTVSKFLIRRIVIYPTITILIFLVSKYYFPTKADKLERERLKDFPKTKIIQDPIHIVGGFTERKEFFDKLFENNGKYILTSVLGLCGFAVADRYSSVLSEILEGASPAITVLPLPLARRLLAGFQSVDPKEILTVLKNGLLSNELTMEEKLTLLKRSLKALLISANTTRLRRSLLLTALLIVIGTVLTSGPLFSGALLVFQDIFTKVGFKRSTVEFIICIYQDFNAPIPLELYKLMEEVKLVPSLGSS